MIITAKIVLAIIGIIFSEMGVWLIFLSIEIFRVVIKK